MDIKNVLIYLKEELKDIPANPDNIHYTDFEGLYGILQDGLRGGMGGYYIKSPKTKKGDMELCTVRNSHKLTKDEMGELSAGATGGVRINLFTDRILAGHRGTKKDTIAELPANRMNELKKEQKDFFKRYGFKLPKLYKGGNDFSGDDIVVRRKSRAIVLDWLKEHYPEEIRNEVLIGAIYWHNSNWYHYYKELREREREERFILKKSIPVDPKFMEIVIEELPHSWGDKEFCKDKMHIQNYLDLLEKHDDVFVHNKAFRDFKNYLRDNI